MSGLGNDRIAGFWLDYVVPQVERLGITVAELERAGGVGNDTLGKQVRAAQEYRQAQAEDQDRANRMQLRDISIKLIEGVADGLGVSRVAVFSLVYGESLDGDSLAVINAFARLLPQEERRELIRYLEFRYEEIAQHVAACS
jgi:hypothetical protein